MRLAYWLITLLLWLPIVPIILAWRGGNRPRLLVILLAIDVVYLLAGLYVSSSWLLGANYSSRLHTTVGVNLALTAVTAVIFAAKRQWYGFAGGILLTCDWLYVSAVSAAG